VTVWDRMGPGQRARERAWARSLVERDRLVAEVNQRRQEDWEATVGGYAALGAWRAPREVVVPRANGFTPHRPAVRRAVASARGREADIDAALDRSLARLRARGIHTGG